MDIFEQIKKIPITQVLDMVGIKYKQTYGTLHLYEGDKLTDGWKGNLNENFITDFTGKRAQGDNLAFIEKYLKISRKEAVEWFKNHFSLIDNKNGPQKQERQINIKKIFDAYQELTDKQKEYLQNRGIDYEKVKDVVKNNNGGIACMIYDENGQAISINTRSIDNKIFYILPGTKSKGVYMGDIDKTNKKVYVVEGMFDFLSLRQYTKNVIGLKSANDGIEVVKAFYNKGYEITIIPDNDEAGKKVLEQLKDLKYYLFDLSKYEVKDINEFLVESGFGEDILEIIDEEKVKAGYQEEFEIVDYEETLYEGIRELEVFNPKDAISWGFEELDNKIGYLLPGQLVLIGGTTGTGKSTFVSEIAKNASLQGIKVLKFTLEDRLEDRKKQELYYAINKIRRLAGLQAYPFNDFIVNAIKSPTLEQEKQQAIKMLIEENKNIKEVKRVNEKQIDIENLEMIVKKGIEMGCKLIILDHLQEFKVEGSLERQDLRIEEMMYKIKNIARKYKIAIILIAHFRKTEGRPTENSFKDSVAIVQVPNKVLLLYRDKLNPDGITELIIPKNRENPRGTGVIELYFDLDNLKYTNKLSEKVLKPNPFGISNIKI